MDNIKQLRSIGDQITQKISTIEIEEVKMYTWYQKSPAYCKSGGQKNEINKLNAKTSQNLFQDINPSINTFLFLPLY